MCIRLTALQQAFQEVQITMTTLGLYARGFYLYIYISKGVRGSRQDNEGWRVSAPRNLHTGVGMEYVHKGQFRGFALR